MYLLLDCALRDPQTMTSRAARPPAPSRSPSSGGPGRPLSSFAGAVTRARTFDDNQAHLTPSPARLFRVPKEEPAWPAIWTPMTDFVTAAGVSAGRISGAALRT